MPSIEGSSLGLKAAAGCEANSKTATTRDQLGQFRLAVLQRAGARRAAGADLVRPDDHLRHARRAQPRARRHVHARRLCRLARLYLHRLVRRRRHRRLAVRHAGRRGDGAGDHPPFLRPTARGPAARHLRPRHRLRRDGAVLLRQPVEGGAAAAAAGRHHAARLHVLSDLPAGAARHRRGRRCSRSTSCSIAPASA